MKKMMKHTNKGFTLVELMLIVGLIALAVIAIYTVYNKKRTETLVKNQTIYLEQINNGLNSSFNSTTNFAVLNATNVIASRIVPNSMVQSSTTVRNLWGGDVTFSGVNGTPPLFNISLANIPSEACTLLSTTDFASRAREVIVNGTALKPAGSVVTATTISNATTACATSNSNTVAFRNPVVNTADINTVDPGSNRDRETPYYIPTTGIPVTSGPPSCQGGTSWNGSFCSCPINSEWDGHTCVAYNSKPGACPMGQGWNGTSCVVHNTGVSGPGGTYLGGRALPNIGFVPNQVQQTQPSAVCHTGASTPGNYDTKTCQTCANGSWNGFRCVMP